MFTHPSEFEAEEERSLRKAGIEPAPVQYTKRDIYFLVVILAVLGLVLCLKS